MKVVKLKELIDMPPGTIFSHWEPCHSHGLYCLQEKFLDNDYYYISLLPEPKDLNEGEDQPVLLADTMFRHGMYDENETYAVYEEQDLMRFNEFIVKALKTVVKEFFYKPMPVWHLPITEDRFTKRLEEIRRKIANPWQS